LSFIVPDLVHQGTILDLALSRRVFFDIYTILPFVPLYAATLIVQTSYEIKPQTKAMPDDFYNALTKFKDFEFATYMLTHNSSFS
jgi:hypothetical protein